MKKWFKNQVLRFVGWIKRRSEFFLVSENEKNFCRIARQLEECSRQNKKYSQDNCPHIAGCNALSELQDMRGRTSIVWHGLDTGQDVGVCTVCQRVFQPSDSDYQEWREKPSLNRYSQAGQRKGFPPNTIPTFPVSREVTTPISMSQTCLLRRLQGDESEELPDFVPSYDELNNLSDEEVSNLFERVQTYYKGKKTEALHV